MSYTITSTHYLEVNGVPLHTPAWQAMNLEPALLSPTLRGQDQPLWRATGSRRRPRYISARIIQLQLMVFHNKAWDNSSYSDVTTGVITNVEYLIANLGIASPTAVTATWHRSDASTKTASVDIHTFQVGDLGTHRDAMCVLELSLPAGSFT